MTLDFLDLLAWRQCPDAAIAGRRALPPRGDEAAALRLLQDPPVLPRALPSGRAVDRNGVLRWLAATRYGLSRTSRRTPAAPPSARAERGYWTSAGGHATGYVFAGDATVIFDVPYLHRVMGVWEIVVADMHEAPPTFSRYAELVAEASFLSECFRELTGEWAGVRLLAPFYEREELLETSEQHLLSFARMRAVLEPFAYAWRGSHCNERTGQERWRCPLRQTGRCTPWTMPVREDE